MNQMRRCGGGYKGSCIRVVEDDRERNSETKKFLSDADLVYVAIKRLAVSDYSVDLRASLAELL